MSFDPQDPAIRDHLMPLVCQQARDMMVLGRLDEAGELATVWCNQTFLRALRREGQTVAVKDVQGVLMRDAMTSLGLSEAEIGVLRRWYLQARETGKSQDFEERRETSRGSFHYASTITPLRDREGPGTYYLYSSRDITEQRLAEAELRESESKFATAFRMSPLAMVLVEASSGEILEVNEGFSRVSGYGRDEVMGRTVVEVGLLENETIRQKRVARLRREGELHGVRSSYRCKDGSWTDTVDYAALVELGGRTCILNAIEDITEQLRQEKARSVLEQQLRQSQKLEALGTLAGGIAHDFNNILTALLANCELGLLDIGDTASVEKRLQGIHRSCLRARDLVRRILAFSRQQPHQRSSFQLEAVLREIGSLLESSLPASIQVRLEFPDHAEPVVGDPGQIHQVLLNLATNAGHAMRERGGELQITLSMVQLDSTAAAAAELAEPGGYAKIEVRDQGPGIPAEIQHRIFEPFFTTKGPGEGTGLGLSVVHGIVRDHGGAVQVCSQIGRGTTMTVFLPTAEMATRSEVIEADTVTPPGEGQQIMVVDDEAAIGDLLQHLLRSLGYQASCFDSAEVAWEAFVAEPDRYALLLTDLTMRGWSGLDLVTRVRELRPGLPVCVMTGFSGRLNKQDLDRVGGGELILKPLERAELASQLHAAFTQPPGGGEP